MWLPSKNIAKEEAESLAQAVALLNPQSETSASNYAAVMTSVMVVSVGT